MLKPKPEIPKQKASSGAEKPKAQVDRVHLVQPWPPPPPPPQPCLEGLGMSADMLEFRVYTRSNLGQSRRGLRRSRGEGIQRYSGFRVSALRSIVG